MDKILAMHVSVGRTLDIKDEPAMDYYSVSTTKAAMETFCYVSSVRITMAGEGYVP